MPKKKPAVCSIAEARTSGLPALIRRSERGPVQLTRRGEPVAMLLSLRDYEELSSGPSFVERIQRFRATHDLEALDAGSAFADLRDRSPGRTFSWD